MFVLHIFDIIFFISEVYRSKYSVTIVCMYTCSYFGIIIIIEVFINIIGS